VSSPPSAAPTAPDLIEPVAAFREWLIVRGGLTSPYIPYRWEEPVVHARCFPANRNLQFGRGWLEEPHEAPHPSCKCGIYAVYAPRVGTPFPDAERVWGVVTTWGRIEVHSDGMRAQHARIEALALGVGDRRGNESALGRIAAALGVDLVEWEELPEVAADRGRPLPAELTAAAESEAPRGGM
jgi:hypothetical protein